MNFEVSNVVELLGKMESGKRCRESILLLYRTNLLQRREIVVNPREYKTQMT